MENGRTSTDHDTDADAIIEVAQDAARQATPIVAGTILESSYTPTLTDTERFADEPRAKRGTVVLHTAGALIQYVNAHKAAGSALFADVQARSVVAILNDHVPLDASDGEHVPGWRDHRAELRLRHTPEWERWMKRDGEIGPQVKFAEHIEDGIAEITDPTGSYMLELAQSIEATSNVQFRSAERLTDGQRTFLYEQDIQTKAGQGGNLTIPDTFQVALGPFEGGARYAMTARLRTRLEAGSLKIGYVLERVEDVLRLAFDDMLTGTAEAENAEESIESRTGLTAYRGSAPNALRNP